MVPHMAINNCSITPWDNDINPAAATSLDVQNVPSDVHGIYVMHLNRRNSVGHVRAASNNGSFRFTSTQIHCFEEKTILICMLTLHIKASMI